MLKVVAMLKRGSSRIPGCPEHHLRNRSLRNSGRRVIQCGVCGHTRNSQCGCRRDRLRHICEGFLTIRWACLRRAWSHAIRHSIRSYLANRKYVPRGEMMTKSCNRLIDFLVSAFPTTITARPGATIEPATSAVFVSATTTLTNGNIVYGARARTPSDTVQQKRAYIPRATGPAECPYPQILCRGLTGGSRCVDPSRDIASESRCRDRKLEQIRANT